MGEELNIVELLARILKSLAKEPKDIDIAEEYIKKVKETKEAG